MAKTVASRLEDVVSRLLDEREVAKTPSVGTADYLRFACGNDVHAGNFLRAHGQALLALVKSAEAAEQRVREVEADARWIPVAERLPTDKERPRGLGVLLVYDPEGGVRFETQHPDWWNTIDKRGREFNGATVTHWRLEPKGPTGTGSGSADNG